MRRSVSSCSGCNDSAKKLLQMSIPPQARSAKRLFKHSSAHQILLIITAQQVREELVHIRLHRASLCGGLAQSSVGTAVCSVVPTCMSRAPHIPMYVGVCCVALDPLKAGRRASRQLQEILKIHHTRLQVHCMNSPCQTSGIHWPLLTTPTHSQRVRRGHMRTQLRQGICIHKSYILCNHDCRQKHTGQHRVLTELHPYSPSILRCDQNRL